VTFDLERCLGGVEVGFFVSVGRPRRWNRAPETVSLLSTQEAVLNTWKECKLGGDFVQRWRGAAGFVGSGKIS